MPTPLPTRPDVLLQEALTAPAEALRPDHLHVTRQAGLGGTLRARLPADHPWREELTADARTLAVRHARTRHALRPLLRAWADAAIPALLIKGFALSEWEYDTPGERSYGDVDILLPANAAVIHQAVQIARTLGWQSDRLEDAPGHRAWLHECTHLFDPHGLVRIDVHRWIVPALYVSEQRAVALTDALWRDARQVDWDGLPVLRPDPRDELLLALVVNRVWSGDHGGLKPSDYVDVSRLARHVTPGALQDRAQQLGLPATWAAFRELCDPARCHLQLDWTATRPVLSRALKADGGWTRLPLRERLGRILFLLPAVPAALMDVVWAARVVRRGGDPRLHLARCPAPAGVKAVTPDVLDRILTVTRHVTHWLHPRQRREGICVPRAYASYRALRRAGHPVRFVSGVARHGGALLSHAWVEDHLGQMDAYGEPRNRAVFRPLLEFTAD